MHSHARVCFCVQHIAHERALTSSPFLPLSPFLPTFRSSDQVVAHLSRSLAAKGAVDAHDCCRLLLGQLPTALPADDAPHDMVLLGCNHRGGAVRTRAFPTALGVKLTEVAAFAALKARNMHALQLVPGLHVYLYWMALVACECGEFGVALSYCDAIAGMLAQCTADHCHMLSVTHGFVSAVISLALRIFASSPESAGNSVMSSFYTTSVRSCGAVGRMLLKFGKGREEGEVERGGERGGERDREKDTHTHSHAHTHTHAHAHTHTHTRTHTVPLRLFFLSTVHCRAPSCCQRFARHRHRRQRGMVVRAATLTDSNGRARRGKRKENRHRRSRKGMTSQRLQWLQLPAPLSRQGCWPASLSSVRKRKVRTPLPMTTAVMLLVPGTRMVHLLQTMTRAWPCHHWRVRPLCRAPPPRTGTPLSAIGCSAQTMPRPKLLHKHQVQRT